MDHKYRLNSLTSYTTNIFSFRLSFAGCVQMIKWAHEDELFIFPLQKGGLFQI